jgi:hypothetical protein
MLLSIGDQVVPGCYALHSRFARAVNFTNGRTLLSLVDDSVGAGPLNIVIPDLRSDGTLKQASQVCIDAGMLIIGNRQLGFNENQRYCSEFTIRDWSPACFWQNLSFFRQLAAEVSAASSLAFLIDESRLGNFQTSFGRAFMHQITFGASEIFGGDLLKGIALLKGCGYGLTPSGDDFLAGLLIALNVLQQTDRQDFRNTLEAVYYAALGDNIVSNTFLDLARRGLVFERMRDLLTALLQEGTDAVQSCGERLLDIGETSGADLATGFVMTLCNRSEAVARWIDSAAAAPQLAAITEVGVA